jgi:hypothetical protein
MLSPTESDDEAMSVDPTLNCPEMRAFPSMRASLPTINVSLHEEFEPKEASPTTARDTPTNTASAVDNEEPLKHRSRIERAKSPEILFDTLKSEPNLDWLATEIDDPIFIDPDIDCEPAKCMFPVTDIFTLDTATFDAHIDTMKPDSIKSPDIDIPPFKAVPFETVSDPSIVQSCISDVDASIATGPATDRDEPRVTSSFSKVIDITLRAWSTEREAPSIALPPTDTELPISLFDPTERSARMTAPCETDNAPPQNPPDPADMKPDKMDSSFTDQAEPICKFPRIEQLDPIRVLSEIDA